MVALIAVPLAYNSQGRDGFEPVKMAFVRLFGLALAAALAVRWVGSRLADRERSPSHRAAFILVALTCASLVVSNVLSVFPFQSFWGSFQQRQGVISEACCILFCLAAAFELRRDAQVGRFVTALIVPTIPAGLIAVAERFGADPLRIIGTEGGRVVSLAGNAANLAAYVGMVFPFTLLRVSALMRSRRAGLPGAAGRLAFYAAIAVLQLAAIVFTESRGPFLALVAAVLFQAVVRSAMVGRRQIYMVVIGGAAIAGFLIVLGSGSGAVGPLARLPLVARLSRAVPHSVSSTEEGRVELWSQAEKLLLSPEAIRLPPGPPDRWSSLRPLFGYGPETLEGVLPLRLSLGTPAPPLMSRFHNLFWDLWYSRGLVGLSAFLGLVAVAIGAGFARLGLIGSRSDWIRFGVISTAVATVTSGLLWFRFGSGFLGLGLVGGLVCGFAAYACLRTLLHKGALTMLEPGDDRAAFLIAALAAIVFHMVETSFSFPISITALLGWICLGIAIGDGRETPEVRRGPRSPPQSGTAGSARAPLAGALLGALVAGLTCFSLVGGVWFVSVSPAEVAANSLFHLRIGSGVSFQLATVLLPALAGAAFAFSRDEMGCPVDGRSRRAFLVGIGFAAAAGLFSIVFRSMEISAVSRVSKDLSIRDQVLAAGGHYEMIILVLMAGNLAVLAGVGWCLQPPAEADAGRWRKSELQAGGPAMVAAVILAWFACLRPVWADSFAGLANAENQAGSLDAAVEAYSRALVLVPNSSAYRFEQVQFLAARAEASSDSRAFDSDMSRAEGVMTDGLAFSRLDPQASLMLGQVRLRWASGPVDAGRSRALAREAKYAFGEALMFKPVEEYALVGLAASDQVFLEDAAGAKDALEKAENLVPASASAEWFDAYSQQCTQARNPGVRLLYEEQALWFWRKASGLAVRSGSPRFGLDLRLGVLHYALGELPAAREAFQSAVDLGGDPDLWKAEGLLAKTLAGMGDWPAAASRMERAVGDAPEEAREPLEAALRQFRSHAPD